MNSRDFYFDPDGTGPGVFLGPTETELMEVAWRRSKLTVKQALFYLGDESPRAYTTVMTVLARLARKGFLKRTKTGRVYTYSPTATRDQFLAERIGRVRSCLKQFGRKG